LSELLYVFSYDISNDRARRRTARVLSRRAARVLESVFEARLTPAAAERLAARALREIGGHGHLRVYAVGASTQRRCLAFGGPPPQGPEGYWLL
jgi:CRISPR-associated protein Cas2